MHGEHVWVLTCLPQILGPSPHARGTRMKASRPRRGVRTIPACTGNTTARFRRFSPSPDHPRMHGEHSWGSWMRKVSHGPSPHARGTHDRRPPAGPDRRTIPACTGNTRAGTRPNSRRPDHPRMHGEHAWPLRGCITKFGPSPHARGTLAAAMLAVKLGRTIPACTGNTLLLSRFSA